MSSDSIAPEGADAYATSWRALNKLMRRGWSWSGNERHCTFWQDSSGAFHDVSRLAALDLPEDGRAAAVLDWDEDGDEDLLVTARTGPRVRLFSNRGEPGHASLTVLLEGTRSNPDAVGARVELERAGGARAVRTVQAGSGYLAQSSGRVSFGLGPDAREDPPRRLRVRWPGGALETFEDLPSAGRVLVREGSGAARAVPRRALDLPTEGGQWTPADQTGDEPSVRLVTLAPVPIPRIPVVLPDGETRSLFGVAAAGDEPREGALLVLLTADWCAPCRAEVSALVAGAEELARAGVRVLALATDPSAERERVRERFAQAGWPWALAFAEEEALAVLDGLQGVLRDSERPLALPTALLLDGLGRVVVLYEGRVGPERVARDAALIDLGPAERRDAAAHGPGRWLDPEPTLEPGLLAERFRARGLEHAAAELERLRLDVRRVSAADLRHDFGLRAGEAGRLQEAIAHFQAALEADPDHFPSWRDLGVALHRDGRPAQAVDAYAQALRLRPEDPRMHYLLALAYLAADDRDAAIEELEWLREAESDLARDLEIAFARAPAVR